MPLYSIGAAVLRREDRPERRATVVEIVEGVDDLEAAVYRLAYAEGGEGWWPQDDLDADPGRIEAASPGESSA